ncbi:MAG: hypothetical protein FJ128_00100 [Deltaproteobacteria bacterium]|nr:hypothetical protein [Deltaproteobacteria bacterium]
MKPEILTIAILFGAGAQKPEVLELVQGLPHTKLLFSALDAESFLARIGDRPPKVALLDLDNATTVPTWLDSLVKRLPRCAILVTCHNLDPLFIIKIMQRKVRDYLTSPLQREELLAALDRVRTDPHRESGEGASHCQTVVVAGAKGGVGTTCIATNLAVAMAERQPGRVVLVDLARPFPNVGQFLDLKSPHSIMDLVDKVDRLDSVFLGKILQNHPRNLTVLLGYGGLSLNAHPLLEPDILDKIFHSLKASFDWIVVDLGHWLDSLYLKVVEEADQILLVTELSVPDLQNLKKIHGYFQHWQIDPAKIRLVVNRYSKSFTLGLRDLEGVFQKPADFALPSDYANLIEAINQGAPLAEVAPRSKLWRELQGVAESVIRSRQVGPAAAAPPRKSWWRRLFSSKE